MHRRSFLGALCAAPFSLPAVAKDVGVESGDSAIAQHVITVDPLMHGSSWAVRLDRHGCIVGFDADPMPVFAVKEVGGKPQIVVRDEIIEHLHGMAARQNATLA